MYMKTRKTDQSMCLVQTPIPIRLVPFLPNSRDGLFFRQEVFVCGSCHLENVELFVPCYLQISDHFARKHMIILDLNELTNEEQKKLNDEHKIHQ